MSVRVELIRVDEKQELIHFTHGKHVLGRGATLKCDETKISRNHAVLEVSDENQEVTITSIHSNPCFYQTDKSDFLHLKKGELRILKNGDRISLLPTSWTYKVIIKINSDDKTNDERNQILNGSTSNKNNRKRKLPSWLNKLSNEEVASHSQSSPRTKKRVNLSKSQSTSQSSTSMRNSNEKKVNKRQKKSQNSENDENSQKETKSKIDEENTENETKSKIDEENTENETQSKIDEENSENETQSTNENSQNTNSQIKHCPYGSQCYRKNPKHFEEFSHDDSNENNNGSDDEDDDRPECEYGLDCYRKNPQHLKDFKHVKQKRTAAKMARQTTKMLGDEDDDSIDSFIASDDDDPEYSASDSESDDDEFTDLMQEAKSFIKGTKK